LDRGGLQNLRDVSKKGGGIQSHPGALLFSSAQCCKGGWGGVVGVGVVVGGGIWGLGGGGGKRWWGLGGGGVGWGKPDNILSEKEHNGDS